ncbi:bifunctional biotin--[acetyl-CoA-carboxylase] ligase/biotin operon repressor BirA [Alteromonas oceanisediminis]|uniref:bifunctional biotin--[acetyl-CoA-carboxylase] ligase/biotin operon repressor BirA n=1 Tax=Alteromonas oceanisediminis TaxID=2836180 RepID=UPI001BDB2FEC|nr:bifunctional biotin--[acetyl-CoA-carboxylase] ligase/biotin operon repressor BirA [Alteromonas oceanisediminis]MBT0587789.1 bifunctional biotin--[acetyl-CoA-carboxylase] ligase/biotin operon repressor BirA [Alteromonas oceanisediminis]
MSDSVNLIRSALIQYLCDDQFHSGQALADALGVSRTAIANHISAINALGLDIYSVKGKGYKLARHVELLDETRIRLLQKTLSDTQTPITDYALTVLPVIASTNTFMKERIDHITHGETILAEAQTAGRGRRGKVWVSPFGASLYLSLCWRFQGGYQQIGGLSLFVGYVVVQALLAAGVDGLGLKWPNDIYRYGKKLGGILVEVEGQIGGEVACIIGIGLNVDLGITDNGTTAKHLDPNANIDQPVADLSDITQDRNSLAARVLNELYRRLPDFEQSGLGEIATDWNQLDVFAQKSVTVQSGDRQAALVGKNLGIDETGALRLKMDAGIKTIHGGEVSLRALP